MAKKTAPSKEILERNKIKILRYIAFTDSSNYDEIGDYAVHIGDYKYSVTNVTKQLIEEGILTGTPLKSGSYNTVKISDILRCAIIATMPIDEAEKLYSYEQKYYKAQHYWRRHENQDFILLARALNAYCQMNPAALLHFRKDICNDPEFSSELEKKRAAEIWTGVQGELDAKLFDPEYLDIVEHLILKSCFTDFFCSLSVNSICNLIERKINRTSILNFVDDFTYKRIEEILEKCKQKFGAETYHLMQDRLVFFQSFLRKGDIDAHLAQMHHLTIYYTILLSIKHIQEGDALAAFKLLDSALKAENCLCFGHPYFNYIYGLSILMSDSAAVLKKAESLLKKKVIKESTNMPSFMTLLQMKAHPETDFDEWIDDVLLYSGASTLEKMLFSAICKNYKYKSCFTSYANGYIENLEQLNVNVILLELYAATKKDEATQSALEQSTKMHHLIPQAQNVEPWQKVIDALMIKCGGSSTSGKARKSAAKEISRIVYEVSEGNFSVQPRLQKSKDGGVTWSSGRNIALTTFQKGLPEMTAQDSQISKLVETYSYGWYGGTTHELRGEKVVEALIGHPYVFSSRNPELKIEVEAEKLQIEIKEDTRGHFKVSHNAYKSSTGYDKLYIHVENPQLYRVIRLTNEEIEILQIFDRVTSFPKEAKTALIKLLESLGSKVTVVSSLLKNSEVIAHKKGDSKLTMQLVPYGEEFVARCFVKPIANNPPYCTPGKGLEFIAANIKGKSVQIERNMKKERQNLKDLQSWMEPFDEYHDEKGWTVPMIECLQLLDILREHQDSCYVEWPEGVRLRVQHPTITPSSLKLSVKGIDHWFQVDGEVQIDETKSMQISELLNRVRESKGNFIQIADGEYVALSQQLKKYLASLDHIIQTDHKKLKVASYNTSFLQDLSSAGVEMKVDKSYQEFLQHLQEADEMKIKVPKTLQADLRDYQKDGYRWMCRLAHWGAGACLADDMGLGKTVQTIALLLSHASNGASLVVMPTSVLLNWRDELARFAPSLNVIILRQASNREEAVRNAGPQDVVLTTYGLLPTEEEILTTKQWNIIVLDEAHTIKNKETKTSKVAMQMDGKFRLLLTGTPLQNHLSEIWNLFQFATPGLLSNFTQFTQEFITPIERDQDKDRQRLLKRLLSPFILRRTKSEVLNELPEKTEITLKVELSPLERALYDRFREEAILNMEDGSTSPIQALAELTKLRQTVCNAALVLPKKEAKAIPSTKMETFLKLVEDLHRNHHRALVFSQFTSHLALVREALDALNISYEYLDGSTSSTERISRVDSFQKGDKPLFLISLKAGGVGLNLTAADYVIHLDPWWNPAIEDQASDRAYRIGQDKPVTVYRLIAEDTIEEKIIALHQTKKSLADALLEGSDMSHALGKDEILALLRDSMK